MPQPPPRPRRALPIPGRRPAVTAPVPVPVPVPVPAPARMPCGSCAALLSVPASLTSFACPLCGVELTVDGGRLRVYFASPTHVSVSVLAPPPAGITLWPSPHQRPEDQVEKHNHPTRSIHREQTFSSSKTVATRTMLAQKEPSIHSAHREESRIEPLDKNIAKTSVRKTKFPACPESTGAENVRRELPMHVSSGSRAQVCPSNYSVCAQGQQPVEDIASHGQQINEYRAASSTIQHETAEAPNHVNCAEQAQGEYHRNTTGWNLKRKRSGNSASVQKGKKKGLGSYPNGGFHLRRSSRLSKQPENPINNEPEAQFDVMHAQQEDAQRAVKSSGKRRGRGPQPTRLIQPRREVDRPVLTPNIIDKWDVNPPCPKVASTITILLKQKYPGSTYLPVGQRREVPPNGEVVLHWQQYPPETKDAILNEFLQRYKWAPGREAECLKLFERRVARQFAGILSEEKRKVRVKFAAVDKSTEATGTHRSNRHAESEDEDQEEDPEDQQALERHDDDDPLLWKPCPPAWMYPSWWERLCEHWAKEEVLKMSSQNRKNRYTGGHAHHTSGSRSIAMHRQIMVIENGGMPVSELDVFNKTHRRKGGTGEFISERAKRTVEGFKKRMEAGDKIHPHLAWVQEVGGRNRGRYYGLTGIIDKDKVDELAKSTPDCFGIKGHRQKFTQEQVQQMINQALQGLNETWEKKFKSLEQSACGLSPLGIDPEHAPGSSAAREVGQEDRSRHHQDASDAQTGESCEDDDEEVVSTSV